jgi:2-phospho-L-lactate guanylyltransferase (CobY/MobA/RfbA family)
MAKKLERQIRKRNLTPEEVAHDEDVRRKVKAEFPPARPSVLATPHSLSEALKQAIRESDKSEYQIAQLAGVSQIVISRFLSGERDIRMNTADKLAGALELKLGIRR